MIELLARSQAFPRPIRVLAPFCPLLPVVFAVARALGLADEVRPSCSVIGVLVIYLLSWRLQRPA